MYDSIWRKYCYTCLFSPSGWFFFWTKNVTGPMELFPRLMRLTGNKLQEGTQCGILDKHF